LQLADVGGAELEFEDHGTGAPIVFIHGSLFGDALAPLSAEPNLRDRFRRVLYHRRGYARSTHSNRPLSMAEQAEDCRLLMLQRGVARAHVVGYSYGGAIALQLALDAPDVVESLAVLEPPLLNVPSAASFFRSMGPAIQSFQSGESSAAVDAFSRLVFGKEYRRWLDGVLPGAFGQAVVDADTLFRQEWPALREWLFGPMEGRSISQPTLAVLGEYSPEIAPIFAEGHQLLLEWLPQIESFVLPCAGHGMAMQNPRGLARRLATFFESRARAQPVAMRAVRGETLPKRR
jgi:pimeloyl-ACP methyl ester carboxylesterase